MEIRVESHDDPLLITATLEDRCIFSRCVADVTHMHRIDARRTEQRGSGPR